MKARAPAALALACAALLSACGERAAPSAGANPERGKLALSQYGCQACHTIPGVTGPRVFVGPPLEGLGQRKFIAGSLPNTHDNLVRWIRNPQQVDPLTAMPALDVAPRDAADMAAYLLQH
ncbi:MAG TPA: c-type cytochrome [Telluria sp.]|nr:c-type cytochrome [Telluria sp.]